MRFEFQPKNHYFGVILNGAVLQAKWRAFPWASEARRTGSPA